MRSNQNTGSTQFLANTRYPSCIIITVPEVTNSLLVGCLSRSTTSGRREESHFAKVKTSCGLCLSVISTFTGTCEISSATVCSECHPIPNQMTDAGCHKNDRSGDSNQQQAPGRGLSVSGMMGILQPSEATLPAPVKRKDGVSQALLE